MLQFPHVAGPGVLPELAQGSGTEFRHGLPVAGRVHLREVLGQQLHVVVPFAQGRQHDFDRIEAVHQVLAESTAGYQGVQRGVGGRQQPDIHRYGCVASYGHHLAVLQGREQLGLLRQANVANLIQKQGSSGGRLEPAHAAGLGIRERALGVPKQLAFKQPLAERGHVGGHKGPGSAARLLVQGLGDQLLARAVLAEQQHVGFGWGDLFNNSAHFLHGG